MTTPRSPSRSAQGRRQSGRERRITAEIIVDAYGPEERTMGWYYYLDGKLRFPFRARCLKRRSTLPLRIGEIVNVTAMAPEDDCAADMIVLVRLDRRTFGVPLSQLQPHAIDAETAEAIADWHYWCSKGYQF
jgi:hypothetical protein